jgi:putative transcriptional regulator
MATRLMLDLMRFSSSVQRRRASLPATMGSAMADSLRGKLLIAGPTLLDPNFARTVILIAEHTEEGAMGLVLNRPAETLVDEAVPDLGWLAAGGERVWVGGPVGSDADQPDQLDGAIRRARVFAGHAGWGPGQLEEELAEESWIVEPPRREEIFTDDPDALWRAVLRRKGSRFALLATMPQDPSVN